MSRRLSPISGLALPAPKAKELLLQTRPVRRSKNACARHHPFNLKNAHTRSLIRLILLIICKYSANPQENRRHAGLLTVYLLGKLQCCNALNFIVLSALHYQKTAKMKISNHLPSIETLYAVQAVSKTTLCCAWVVFI